MTALELIAKHLDYQALVRQALAKTDRCADVIARVGLPPLVRIYRDAGGVRMWLTQYDPGPRAAFVASWSIQARKAIRFGNLSDAIQVSLWIDHERVNPIGCERNES